MNELDECEAQTSGQAAIPGQTELANDLPLKPESRTGRKHQTQTKAPKQTKSGTQKTDIGNIPLLHLLISPYINILGPCNGHIDF